MFIVIDGPDGSGKTTLAKNVVKTLSKLGYPAIYTKEPMDSKYGRRIREMLRDKDTDPLKMFNLFVKDRIQHIKYIKDWISDGKIVVCDRYKYSTFCYQSLQGIDRELMVINNDLLSPDITFILYSAPQILLDRITARNDKKEIFETIEFQKEVVSKFLSLPNYFDEEFVFIQTENNKEISNIVIDRIINMFVN